MKRYDVTLSSQTVSPPFPLDVNAGNFKVGFGVNISGTCTYSVQHTFDDVQADGYNPATGTWFEHETVTGVSTSQDGNYAYPITALRLNVTAYTSGDITLKAIQGGNYR